MDEPANIPVTIRSFCGKDNDACKNLYREGLLGGKLAENDTGLDIDDIMSAYMRDIGNHFWIAENAAGEIVGTIGVQHHEDHVGEVRRLRVRTDFRRRGIGSALLEQALKFCQDQGYLKITLDTFIEREPAIRLFQRFHFRHSRSKDLNGRQLMFFYLDIYEADKQK